MSLNKALPTATVTGPAAHDAAISGNPVRIAGRGVSADYTAVTTGDTADILLDLNGKQVVLLGAIPENFTSGFNATAITTTTATSIIATPGAGIRLYITSVLVNNTHATVSTTVDLREGTTTTVLYRGYALSAGGGWSISFPTPLRLAANNALEAVCGTTNANVFVSAIGYKAP